jgi:hypothetical protein
MTCALRKKECLENSSCTWVVGKGCKKAVPVVKQCKNMRKKECLESSTCNWTVGKGCSPKINQLNFADTAAMLKTKNNNLSPFTGC